MSLSEETRLELLRLTMKFAADNFEFNAKGVETARTLADSYNVLAEALFGDRFIRILGKIRHLAAVFSRTERPATLEAIQDHLISLLQESIPASLLPVFADQPGEINSQGHSFDFGTHNPTPHVSETHPTDSSSEGRDENVADETWRSASDKQRMAAASLAALLPSSVLNDVTTGNENSVFEGFLQEVALCELLMRGAK